VRWIGGEEALSPEGSPLETAVREGWIAPLPDGELHKDATVTHAAFAVMLERLCRQLGCPGASGIPADDDPISGREVVDALRRALPGPPRHG